MNFLFLRRLAGHPLLSTEDRQEVARLRGELDTRLARVLEHAPGVASRRLKGLRAGFGDDPSAENFERLKVEEGDTDTLELRNGNLRRAAKQAARHFGNRECVPFVQRIVNDALPAARKALEALRASEEAVSERLGVPYAPSGNVRIAAQELREIECELAEQNKATYDFASSIFAAMIAADERAEAEGNIRKKPTAKI